MPFGLATMPGTLVESLGPDTIEKFRRAAPRRIEEGDFLAQKHPLMALYLYGYAVEMILKAAYFTNARYHRTEEIDREARNRAMAMAQLKNLMSRDPHDIVGWARFLVWDKQELHLPAYEPALGTRIITKAGVVYENWRPQMRYRVTSPPPAIVATVRTAADWMIKNHTRM